MEAAATGSSLQEQHDFLDQAKEFDWDAVRKALDTSSDLVNVTPSGRWSALHQAALSGSTEAASMLIQRGADPLKLVPDGRKPSDVADSDAMRKMLLQAEDAATERAKGNGALKEGRFVDAVAHYTTGITLWP